MSKNSIFNVDAVRTTINSIQLEELVTFLLKYRSIVSLHDTRTMLATKSLTETPINRLYERYYQSGKDRLFAFVKIPQEVPSPEIVTYTHVTFDTKQLMPVIESLYRTLTIVPEYSNKIVFNVTSLTKKNNELNNTSVFQSLFVRDLLSRSFYMSNDVWLTPSTLQFLCKTYSMSVAVAIGSVYNLTSFEQQMIATIFALYFLQQVTNASQAEILLKNSGKYLVGSATEISDVITRIKDVLKERYVAMTLSDACKCVTELGINRLSDISKKFLYIRMKSAGPDVNTSAIALEYPPYWAYLVLLAGSGQKIGLAMNMNKSGMLKDIVNFTDDLLKNQFLLNFMI